MTALGTTLRALRRQQDDKRSLSIGPVKLIFNSLGPDFVIGG